MTLKVRQCQQVIICTSFKHFGEKCLCSVSPYDPCFTGYKGSTGMEGFEGMRGDVGVKGFSGSRGEPGVFGEVGPKGVTGHQGPKGESILLLNVSIAWYVFCFVT